MPSTLVNSLYVLSHFSLTTSLWDEYYLPFTDKQTKAHRGQEVCKFSEWYCYSLIPGVFDSKTHFFHFYCFQPAAELWDPDVAVHWEGPSFGKRWVPFSAGFLIRLPMAQLLFRFHNRSSYTPKAQSPRTMWVANTAPWYYTVKTFQK